MSAGTPSVPKEIDAAIIQRMRPTTRATYNFSEFPLTGKSCILNRFLVSRLLKAGVQVIKGRVADVVRKDDKWRVHFDDGNVMDYHTVVLRHGPYAPLKRDFPKILSQCKNLIARADLDQTRDPIWEDFYGKADWSGADISETNVPSIEISSDGIGESKKEFTTAIREWIRLSNRGVDPAISIEIPEARALQRRLTELEALTTPTAKGQKERLTAEARISRLQNIKERLRCRLGLLIGPAREATALSDKEIASAAYSLIKRQLFPKAEIMDGVRVECYRSDPYLTASVNLPRKQWRELLSGLGYDHALQMGNQNSLMRDVPTKLFNKYFIPDLAKRADEMRLAWNDAQMRAFWDLESFKFGPA